MSRYVHQNSSENELAAMTLERHNMQKNDIQFIRITASETHYQEEVIKSKIHIT